MQRSSSEGVGFVLHEADVSLCGGNRQEVLGNHKLTPHMLTCGPHFPGLVSYHKAPSTG